MSAVLLPTSQDARRENSMLMLFRAAFAEKPEVACAILITAGVDAAAGAAKWWHLAGVAEPRFLLVFRAAAVCLAVVNLCAVFDLRHRPRLLHLSAVGGIAGPLLLLLLFATVDGGDMAAAVTQEQQCGRLISSFAQTDFAIGTAWYEHRIVLPPAVASDDYTFADGLETAAFFTKNGFYFGMAGGLLSLLCLWSWDGAAARRENVATRWWLISTGFLILIGDFGRLGLGFVSWNLAQRDAASGDSRQAMRDEQAAAFWDPRFQFDIVDRYQIGRLDGALGIQDSPDYWAMLGDTWLVTGDGNATQGYLTYRLHVADPTRSFELRTRYANAAYQYGALVFPQTPDTAITVWKDGHAADPQNLELIYALALGETKIRRYDAAIADWRLLLSDIDGIGIYQNKFATSSTYIRPLSAHVWSALAWCYFNRKDYDAANQCVYNATLPNAVNPDTVTERRGDHGN